MSAVCLCAGCTEKNTVTVSGSAEDDKVPVSVSIPVLPPVSKVLTTDGENAVNSLQVFVFRKDGTLDAYGKSNASEVQLNCTVGDKDIVAAVNAPDLTYVASMSDFRNAKSELSDNAPGNFVMTGSVPFSISEADNEIPVSVRRLVARLGIRKITNALSAEQYASTPIRIDKIYLTNVAGDRLYSGPSAPSVWLNKSENASECPDLLSSGDLNTSVSAKETYSVPHYFYCYPNSVSSDSSEEVWTPRFTRLVVEATILGKTYYYPVNMENIEANHTYDIEELKITRLGSSDPDVPVSLGSVSLTITVSDWETGASSTVTI